MSHADAAILGIALGLLVCRRSSGGWSYSRTQERDEQKAPNGPGEPGAS